jgi:hypothetical protein
MADVKSLCVVRVRYLCERIRGLYAFCVHTYAGIKDTYCLYSFDFAQRQ